MCEDFPCCGHEAGCCPDFDAGGKQLNMRCTCGARLPLSSRSSICSGCMAQYRRESGEDFELEDRDIGEDEDFDEDFDDEEAEGRADYDDEREYSPDDDGEALLGLGGE